MADPSIQELSSRQLAQTAPNRYADITRIISLGLACFSTTIAATYLSQDTPRQLPYQILGLSFFFVLTYFLSKKGYHTFSRLVLASCAPLLLVVISLLHKHLSIQTGLIDSNDYFNVRIILVFMVVIPMSTISITEKKLLVVALLPSFLSVALFDPIHNLFGLGYYQVGMESQDYYFSVNLYTLVTYFFLIASLFFQKLNNFRKQIRLFDKSYKLERYLDRIMAIGNSALLNSGQVQKTYEQIAAVAQKTLGISRVSIWHYHEATDSIHCVHMHDEKGQQHPATTLYAKDYPEYFEYIKRQELIIAEDAQHHPATACFKQCYLEPYNIHSMMDTPFRINGKLGGIICCEQEGQMKSWKTEDSIFLHTLSDFINYLHSTEKLLLQSQELQEKNEEISTINEQLEARISVRTHELEVKNKQLSEYAFINSHLLRAPIARIAGLVNIIEMMYGPIVHREYTDHIKASVDELDDVTRRISKAIEEYGEVNREHITLKE